MLRQEILRYLGGYFYAGADDCCLVEEGFLILSMMSQGLSAVWGKEIKKFSAGHEVKVAGLRTAP